MSEKLLSTVTNPSTDDAPQPGFKDWAGMVTIQP